MSSRLLAFGGLVVVAAALTPVGACVVEPAPPSCEETCSALADKGCELDATFNNTGGGGNDEPTGCEPSCRQALRRADTDHCLNELFAFLECLKGNEQVSCDGSTFDDIRGCDRQRLAWDTCDGFECDLRGGLSAMGTTDDGKDLVLSFGHTEAECSCNHVAAEQPGVPCGSDTCARACCCGGAISASACIDGSCASDAETCALVEAAPYSCGGA